MKSKKGFTLVELLAVIVVLAIIMVIATMSVNSTIVKSKADAFDNTMDVVVKNAKEIVQLGKLDENLLKERLDYSSDEYEIYVVEKDNSYLIKLKANDSGEFKNVDLNKTNQNDLYLYDDKTICTLLNDDGILSKPDSCENNLEENGSGGNTSGGNDVTPSKNYSVGDEISFTNKDTGKKEEFYVISDDGTTVTALAKYGLVYEKGGGPGYWNDPGCEYIGENSKTYYGLQEEPKLETISDEIDGKKYEYKVYRNYSVCQFGEADYYGSGCYEYDWKKFLKKDFSYPAYIYEDNSFLYTPIQNYVTYFKDSLKINIKARLIKLEELKALGCSDTTCNTNEVNNNNRKWLYEMPQYFTGTANSNYSIIVVDSYMSNGKLSSYSAQSSGASIRPVIEINKSDI